MNKKKSIGKRIFRWLVSGLLAISVVLALLLVLLTLSPGEKIIKGIAEAKLGSILGQEVQIGSLETNLFSRLQIQDVIIFSIQAEDTITFLNLRYGKMGYRLTDLLFGEIPLQSLNMEGLAISLSKDSSGSYNLPLLNTETKIDTARVFQLSFLSLPFRQLQISDSRIEYADESTPKMSASLLGLTIRAESQPDETYRYHIHADSSEVNYQGFPLTAGQLELQGSLTGQELRLDSLSAQLPGMILTGQGRFLPEADSNSLNAFLTLQGNPSSLMQAAGDIFSAGLPPISGELDLTAHVEGSLEHPKLKADLSLPVLDVSGIRIKQGLVQAEYEAGLASLNQFDCQLLGGKISGEGNLKIDSLSDYQISLSVDALNLAEVWRYLYQESSPYQGRIHADLTATGILQNPTDSDISAVATLRQLQYRSKSVPDISTRLTIKRGLAEFSLNQKETEMSGRVRLDKEQLEGEFSGRILRLEPLAGLANLPGLTGNMQFQGALGGKLDSPEIKAKIKARDIRYQNFPVDSLSANVLYQNGHVYFSTARFGGSLDPIDTLQSPFGLSDLSGMITYQGLASGTPDSLEGEITVDLHQPGYGNILFDEGQLRILLEGKTIRLHSMRFKRDSLLIQADGKFDMASSSGSCLMDLFWTPAPGEDSMESPDAPKQVGRLKADFQLASVDQLTVELIGEGMDVDKIRSLLPIPIEVGGMLSFTLDFSMHADNPRAELDLQLIRPHFRLVEMDSLRGSLLLSDDHLQLHSLDLFDRGHHSWVTASVGLEKGREGGYTVSTHSRVKGQAFGRDLDLGLLNTFLGEGIEVGGRGSYELNWDGTLAEPHASGTFALEDGLVQTSKAAPPIQQITLRSSVQDQVVTIDNLSGIIRGTPFSLRGTVGSTGWREFDLQTELSVSNVGKMITQGTISSDSLQLTSRIKRMDLSLLQPFVPDFKQLSGYLNTQLSLSGPTADPQLDGHLEIHELVLQPYWFDTPFREGVVKISFDRDNVKIDSLFLRANGGNIFVSGELSHQGGQLANADIRVSMDSLRIDRPKEIKVLVKSAQFTYRNQNGYFLLDGDMMLGESWFLLNFKPQSILHFTETVEKPKQQLPGFLQRTRLNLRLRESEDLWVDNNLARIRLHTEMGVIGSPDQPNLTGRVTVEEGYLLYLDRKFKVKRGVVDFVDPNRLNPIIDFKAETEIKSYQATQATAYLITLSISGPLDEVVVELLSDPPEDKANILSLLTVGTTREQLVGKDAEGKDASTSGILWERAQSLSSQRIAGYTSRKVGGFLGLEQFTIEGNLFRFDNSWGPQLLASKKISPRMEITYTTTVGHSNENSFRLDYLLSKHFSLEGQTDQQGRSGMNLKYRLRLK
jgi:autotransporter translocation and assembly factor TamB